MALQIQSPYIRVQDSNGLPIVGAKLYVYLPETTTLASIYSDDGLSVPLSNPLAGVNASNARGEFPRAYIGQGTYKLRAETSTGSLIFEEDNIDTGLAAGTGALPISRGGTGATTAAAARSNLDVPSNSELADLAAQIVDLQTALQGFILFPQGYLTPTSGTPVITSDVISGTAVYYTPLIGNQILIYDGTQFVPTTFTELTLTLNSNHVLNSIYDAYVINDSGTVRLVTGPAWSVITAAAGARGTGAGTTELVRTNGLWTNKFAMTARNGATTYSVAANCGTYVGSLYIDGTAGQITCHTSYGQARKWGIWNAYNRKQIMMIGGDSTANWTYSTNTWRQSRADANNKMTLFCGLPEERPSIVFEQNVLTTTGTNGSRIGIGWNITNSGDGFSGQMGNPDAASQGFVMIAARYNPLPFIGINVANMTEITPAAAGNVYQGANGQMQMTTTYWG